MHFAIAFMYYYAVMLLTSLLVRSFYSVHNIIIILLLCLMSLDGILLVFQVLATKQIASVRHMIFVYHDNYCHVQAAKLDNKIIRCPAYMTD